METKAKVAKVEVVYDSMAVLTLTGDNLTPLFALGVL